MENEVATPQSTLVTIVTVVLGFVFILAGAEMITNPSGKKS